MQVNPAVLKQCIDMTGEIRILEKSKCPAPIKPYAEKILEMYRPDKLDAVAPKNYHSITELDKMIMVDYWYSYDSFVANTQKGMTFQEWFSKEATFPDFISRASRWLIAHHYIIDIPEDVLKNAQLASEHWTKEAKK